MWEAIRRNRRRSWLLIGLMGLLLVSLGYTIGSVLLYKVPAFTQASYGLPRGSVEPTHAYDLLNTGGLIGIAVAAGLWLILTTTALFGGDAVLLRTAGAIEIQKRDVPRLWNVVEEMTIAAGLPRPPRVFLIDDPTPNAFAVGRTPQKAAVAVTTGLLKRMNRDELQGVVAHEVGHIHNYDIRFMTLASVMVGSIVLISEVFLRSLWFGGGRRRSSSKGGGQAQLILFLLAIVLAIVAPILARLLFFACSRRREYLADACAARFTRYPPGLASALSKIGRVSRKAKHVSKGLAPLYIVNPLQAVSVSGLFATHPPLDKRIAILNSMGAAGFVDYEAAYRKVFGESRACLDRAFLQTETSVRARKASPQPEPKQDAIERAREAVAVLDQAAAFLLIPCACGMRIKIPSNLTLAHFNCPSCGREHVPSEADPSSEPGAKRTPEPPAAARVYRRKSDGWESFKCKCGGTIQLSPTFSARRVSCRKCGRHV
ncbi:MAG: M48 family metallopeptidase, partial [Phycisphaerae bacterium]